MTAHKDPAGLPAGKFEVKDIRFGALAALIVVLLLILGGTVVITRVLDRVFSLAASAPEAARPPMAQWRPSTTGPQLQVNPAADLIRLREAENVVLTTYAWIDASAGKARIPIARAMAVLSERGLLSQSSVEENGQ